MDVRPTSPARRKEKKMQDRFKFRAVLKTDRFVIIVPIDSICETGYQIDTNVAQKIFEDKYPDNCFFSDFLEIIEKQDYISQYSFDCDLLITKDFTNLMQCTGLKDNTNWEQLTVNEKQDFYNQICNEDGKTIKYKDIDAVRHLWNGKLIYEGDLLQDNKGQIGKVFWNSSTGSFAVNWLMKDGSYETDNCFGYGEIIGNIYENPELLEEKQ